MLKVLRSDLPWFLPSIALGEFRYGLTKSRQRAALESWLEEAESMCTVLVADSDTARYYAEIRSGLQEASLPIPFHDIWIAALAIQHRIPIVSRDAHFDRVPGIRRIGWVRPNL